LFIHFHVNTISKHEQPPRGRKHNKNESKRKKIYRQKANIHRNTIESTRAMITQLQKKLFRLKIHCNSFGKTFSDGVGICSEKVDVGLKTL